MYYHFGMHHVQSNDQLEGSKRMKIIMLNQIFYTTESTANTIKSSELSYVQHFQYHQGLDIQELLLHKLSSQYTICNHLTSPRLS